MAKGKRTETKNPNGTTTVQIGGKFAGTLPAKKAMEPPTANDISASTGETYPADRMAGPLAVQDISSMYKQAEKALKSGTLKKPLRYRIVGAGRRAAVATATLAIAVGALTACGSTDYSPTGAVVPVEGTGDMKLQSFVVQTVDGREIPCVTMRDGPAFGLSCDWNTNAPNPGSPPR